YIDQKTYWNTSIALRNFETDKFKLHAYSLLMGYEVIKGLHIGVSGNVIRELAVDDTITLRESIVNVGAIYDRDVNFIQHDRIDNQQLRVAMSLTNALMNGKVEQR